MKANIVSARISFMHRQKQPFLFLSWWMLLVLVFVFILQVLFDPLTYVLALYPPGVFSRSWQFVTAIFVHGGLDHLLQNLLALGIFGILLEKVIGSWKWAVVFILGGIAGNIAGFFFYPNALSLGASGGIMALIGALAILRPKLIVYFGGPMPIIVLAGLYILVDLAGFFSGAKSGIGHAAHLAGFAVGIIFGILNHKKYHEKKIIKEKIKVDISENEFRKFETENF